MGRMSCETNCANCAANRVRTNKLRVDYDDILDFKALKSELVIKAEEINKLK